ncbi:MAG: hypothetical protein KY460_08690 [Actinobacteria bacterium]|nr:hypothetical protein [Actinomycetota bacterium]
MVHHLVFAIDGIDARLSEPVSLRDTGPPTADSYTDWITQHPQLLGAKTRIVATDLRWQSDTSADEVIIDVLGIGADGRLVVGVVLIDDDPQAVLLRALTQAAYASRLEPGTLADMHARYLRAQGQHRADETALQRLMSHTGAALRPALLARPRMVVFCEHVSPALGTIVVWLDEMGLDIALQRLRAHEIDGRGLLIVSRIFPAEPAAEFEVVRPRRLQAVARPDDSDADIVIDREPAQAPPPPYGAAPDRSADSDVVFTNGFGHGHQPE